MIGNSVLSTEGVDTSGLRFANKDDNLVTAAMPLVDTLLSMLNAKSIEKGCDDKSKTIDQDDLLSFMEQEAEVIKLAPLSSNQISLEVDCSEKDAAIKVLKEHGFTVYSEEYANFFLSFLDDAVPSINIWMEQFSYLEQSIEEKEKARRLLIEALKGKQETINQIGNISTSPEYIFEENETANQVAKILLKEIFNQYSVLSAVYRDAAVKDSVGRCLTIVPAQITYTSGEQKIIVFVGISGYVGAYQSDNAFCQLHDALKPFINQIQGQVENLGAVEFRYIEHASRKYDLLLAQANRVLSGEYQKFLPQNSKLLPTEPLRECAEKKVFSELTKQHLSKGEAGILNILVLGESNIQLPGLMDFNALQKVTPEVFDFVGLSRKAQAAIVESNRVQAQFDSKIRKLKAELIEKGAIYLVEDQSWIIDKTKVTTKSGEKKLQKLIHKFEDFKSKLSKYKVAELAIRNTGSQSMFYIASNINIVESKAETVFYKVSRMPACQNCQKHKLSYLAVIMQGAGMNWAELNTENNPADENTIPVTNSYTPYEKVSSCRQQEQNSTLIKELSPKRAVLTAQQQGRLKPVALF